MHRIAQETDCIRSATNFVIPSEAKGSCRHLHPKQMQKTLPAPSKIRGKTTAPTFVIPTEAKRSGGICSAPRPQTNLKTSHPLTTSEDGYRPNLVIPTEAKRSGGNCSPPLPQTNLKTSHPLTTSEDGYRPNLVIPTEAKRSGGICSPPLPQTNLKTSHPLTTSEDGYRPNLVIPTEAKRSGGICSPPLPQTNAKNSPRLKQLQRKNTLNNLHDRFGRDDKGGSGGFPLRLLGDANQETHKVLAEREGFEPPIPVKVCLISSQVHSTALPSLRFPL